MSETGHIKNIERFAQMITFVNGHGPIYNPANPELSVASLEAVLEAAELAVADLTEKMATNKIAINERQQKFDYVKTLNTRIINSFGSFGPTKEAMDDVKGFRRRFDGRRAEPKVDNPNTPEDEAAVTISASQTSYAQLVQHFDNMLAVIDADGIYNPNENDIKMVALEAISADLKAANLLVMTTFQPRSSARITRDDVLYDVVSGLVQRAALVKKYVKSVFGASSPEYKQISGLKFTTLRK